MKICRYMQAGQKFKSTEQETSNVYFKIKWCFFLLFIDKAYDNKIESNSRC